MKSLLSASNPPRAFKRIVLLSESERLDIQYIPKANVRRFPQGFKYSFNYRAFLGGRWTPLVRWDNSHQGCHIDLLGSRVKLVDPKRSSLRSFEALSNSVVEELHSIRSTLRPAIAKEDTKRIDASLKHLLK